MKVLLLLNNDFESILLQFVAYTALLQIWYCQKFHTFLGRPFSLKSGWCRDFFFLKSEYRVCAYIKIHFARRAKIASVVRQSPPQELEVIPRSGLYLNVRTKRM